MRALLVLLLVAACAAQAHAQRGLVTDISDDVIEIRYSFAGADLLLFGAILMGMMIFLRKGLVPSLAELLRARRS